mmetsp:Transcript_12726/g.18572  ORF Transcript_12726/g.18572 Transcript_12726/m.18572 type:complete len:84 (-) Transcript_12726:274-525(-)
MKKVATSLMIASGVLQVVNLVENFRVSLLVSSVLLTCLVGFYFGVAFQKSKETCSFCKLQNSIFRRNNLNSVPGFLVEEGYYN